MQTAGTTDYSAPEITGTRDLSGSLMPQIKSIPPSDGEIKHRIEPLSPYQAPRISEQRDLSGLTECCKSIDF